MFRTYICQWSHANGPALLLLVVHQMPAAYKAIIKHSYVCIAVHGSVAQHVHGSVAQHVHGSVAQHFHLLRHLTDQVPLPLL